MTVDIETLLTYEDVSSLTKIKVGTLRKYVLRDAIPYCKLNGFVRFEPGKIKKWFEENSHKPMRTGMKRGPVLPAAPLTELSEGLFEGAEHGGNGN